MGRWKGAAALLATSAVLAGCGVGPGGSSLTSTRTTPQTGKGCPTTRRASATLLTTSGRILWRVALRPDEIGDTVPVSSGATVYADTGGQVTALASATGHRLWRRSLGSDIYDEWLIRNELVVNVDQVSDHAEIVGLDPTTGRTRWTYRPGGEGLYGDPIISGSSLIVVPDHPNRVVVIDTQTGRVRWSRKINVPSQPVAGAGVVAVDPAGTLHGFSLQTGRQIWHVARTDILPSLVLDRGTVIVQPQIVTDRTPLAGYAIADGHKRWKLRSSREEGMLTPTSAGLVIAPGYYPTGRAELLLLDPKTGKVVWTDRESGRTWQDNPVVAGADLATIEGTAGANASSRLQYRDLATGRLVADRILPRRVFVASITGAGPKSVWLTGDGKEGLVQSYRGGRLSWSAHIPVFTVDPVVRVRGHGLVVESQDPICGTANARHGKG
jgi:outer membrane protein assembly factor BamB